MSMAWTPTGSFPPAIDARLPLIAMLLKRVKNQHRDAMLCQGLPG
jgi:hypothetical protein